MPDLAILSASNSHTINNAFVTPHISRLSASLTRFLELNDKTSQLGIFLSICNYQF